MQTAVVPKPKRPRTAYNMFFKDAQMKLNVTRTQFNKSSNTAATISERWKELLPSERAMYFQKAAEDKFRYYSEKRDYDDYMESIKGQDKSPKPVKAERKSSKGTTTKRAKGASSPCENTPITMQPLTFESGSSSFYPPVPAAGDVVIVPVKHVPQEDDLPYYTKASIALLASKLDTQSIDFLINALK